MWSPFKIYAEWRKKRKVQKYWRKLLSVNVFKPIHENAAKALEKLEKYNRDTQGTSDNIKIIQEASYLLMQVRGALDVCVVLAAPFYDEQFEFMKTRKYLDEILERITNPDIIQKLQTIVRNLQEYSNTMQKALKSNTEA